MDMEFPPREGSSSAVVLGLPRSESNFRATAPSPMAMEIRSTARFSSASRMFQLRRERSPFWGIPEESNRITTRGAYGTNNTEGNRNDSSLARAESGRLYAA